MSDLPLDVYCFHCGNKFRKKSLEGYENCPDCGKGFKDLGDEAKYAVSMVMKGIIEYYKE